MKISVLIKKILIIMTIGELLYQCDIESRSIFKKYERLKKKISESKWSRNLNEICLKENLTLKLH